MFFLLLQVTDYTSNAMSISVKPLKYIEEMTKRGLTLDCPISVSHSKKISAFRFVYSPKEHELNFIPNVLIDEIVVPFEICIVDVQPCRRSKKGLDFRHGHESTPTLDCV